MCWQRTSTSLPWRPPEQSPAVKPLHYLHELMTWTPCLPFWKFREKSKNHLREHRRGFFVLVKKCITKTRVEEVGVQRSTSPWGVWAELGAGLWRGLPLDCLSRIWRELRCSELWVGDPRGASVRPDSSASPSDPKPSCEGAQSNFSAFSNGSSSLPLPPSFTPSLPHSLSRPLSFSPSSLDTH